MRVIAALGISALAGVALGAFMHRPPPVSVPLPRGGTFNGIRWQAAPGANVDATLRANAACQWLRAWRDGRERPRALRMLGAIAAWPGIRGTAFARAAEDARAGGGETATAVLAGCDASHTREVSYAARMGLTPSL